MSVKVITTKQLTKWGACQEGIKAFKSQKETDSETIIHNLIKSGRVDWANWLLVRVLDDKTKQVKYAVFAARLVLGLYETTYPKRTAPREAIEAAEAWLKNPTADAVGATVYDADAVGATAFAADAAGATAFAAYVADADDVAYAATYAAYAAAYADDVAYAAGAYTEVGYTLLGKLLTYGMTLM